MHQLRRDDAELGGGGGYQGYYYQPEPYVPAPPPPQPQQHCCGEGCGYDVERAALSKKNKQQQADASSSSWDDTMGAAIGFLVCLAFLLLLMFILSYPVSSAYQYDPATERHNVYFRPNPNVYPYVP